MDEIKQKSKTGLTIAAIFLTGIIFTRGQEFSSNSFYGIPLFIVAFGAGWLYYKEKLIKMGVARWIVLLLISAFALGSISVFFK